MLAVSAAILVLVQAVRHEIINVLGALLVLAGVSAYAYYLYRGGNYVLKPVKWGLLLYLVPLFVLYVIFTPPKNGVPTSGNSGNRATSAKPQGSTPDEIAASVLDPYCQTKRSIPGNWSQYGIVLLAEYSCDGLESSASSFVLGSQKELDDFESTFRATTGDGFIKTGRVGDYYYAINKSY